MCGICGEVSYSGEADLASVGKMASAMRSRGPDGGGVWASENLAFGHRRLAILDLSNAAQQPMLDSELGLGIVFNGCIYNFRELKEELLQEGYRFFSSGDTEVVLKAYHAWGADCVQKFLGMFVFAVWERDSGKVVLARDRLGIKPLYLADTGTALRFASSLPALLAAGEVSFEIDPRGLHNYMSLHAVVPPPDTVLRGVKKLPPATILTIQPDGTQSQSSYWKLSVGGSDREERSEEEWRRAVLEALGKAVARRRIADVPTGVLLSGGLDSSLIVALLSEQGEDDIRTFSIGFEAVGDVRGDEFKYSDLIASRFGTTHTRIDVTSKQVLAALPAAVAAMSEPMMSHDAIGFFLLSQEVSKSVSVVQSGQGADEVFGGYHWYPKLLHSADLLDDYARLYFDRDHEEMRRTLTADYVDRDFSREFVRDFLDTAPGARPIDKALQIDSEIMLVDDPVKRVDNMTMAFGLEARVPFLDHQLVELAARIPAELKVGQGGKYILKQAARDLLPPEIIDRPKGYFPVPAFKYIRGPYLDLVRDVLTSARARERGVFNQGYVAELLDSPEAGLTPKGHSKLWQVFIFEYWLQIHGI